MREIHSQNYVLHPVLGSKLHLAVAFLLEVLTNFNFQPRGDMNCSLSFSVAGFSSLNTKTASLSHSLCPSLPEQMQMLLGQCTSEQRALTHYSVMSLPHLPRGGTSVTQLL